MGEKKNIEFPVDELKKVKSEQQLVDLLVNWFRKQSLWVLAYGTGCGAIEVPPTMTARFDAFNIFDSNRLNTTIIDESTETQVTVHERGTISFLFGLVYRFGQ